ncbi:unnamed protein product [Clonostachys byssicola]|uniref:Uncharacterized protein n=1 Tax=Clonostachys byssicola TaxID=160290 RepID=A0A9N9U301_9HYPO|nr:unnamed protein product [Clonostachys byssicola]
MSASDGPPPPKTAAAKSAGLYFYLYWVGLCMHMAMMIIGCLAYTGGANQENLSVRITFTTLSHHVQRAFIAMAALGILLESYLSFAALIYVYRLRGRNYDEDDLFRAIRVINFGCIPWHIFCVIAFGVLLGLASTYVPLLSSELSECNSYGDRLTQCPMVNGTWILAIFYCLWHVGQLLVIFRFRKRLVHFVPEDEDGSYEILPPPVRHIPAVPRSKGSRPPSYRSNLDNPPSYTPVSSPNGVKYKAVLPPPSAGTSRMFTVAERD